MPDTGSWRQRFKSLPFQGSNEKPIKGITGTWSSICPEQRREWISKALSPSCDFKQRLGHGVTKIKEGVNLALTDKQADTTTLQSHLAVSTKAEHMHTLYPRFPLLGVCNQKEIAI